MQTALSIGVAAPARGPRPTDRASQALARANQQAAVNETTIQLGRHFPEPTSGVGVITGRGSNALNLASPIRVEGMHVEFTDVLAEDACQRHGESALLAAGHELDFANPCPVYDSVGAPLRRFFQDRPPCRSIAMRMCSSGADRNNRSTIRRASPRETTDLLLVLSTRRLNSPSTSGTQCTP